MVADAPRTFGPYRILRPLGRGGMGVVYAAEHAGRKETVALKTVLLPDAALLDGIRREIQALAGIRHPGIVRIVDHGLECGVPWYAMELLKGQTLRSYARGLRARPAEAEGIEPWWTERLELLRETEILGTVRLPSRASGGSSERPSGKRRKKMAPAELVRLLTVARRLCAPLSYLHGEGIVHRDLKPANILVKEDGLPVILDFGLMTRFPGEGSREVLDVEEDAVGTVAYMAPEQGQGDLVDARADIYALGCILYELITGQQPFSGATPLEILEKRYHEEPPEPSSLVSGVPPAVDALVARLLSRDPRGRVGHADVVAVELMRLGAMDGLCAEGPRPRPYLYRPGFSGREDSLQAFAPHFTRLYEGEGGLVLIAGESGVGKTRLAMAVASKALATRLQVLTGECLPAAGAAGSKSGVPLQAIRKPLRAIADRCRERGIAETERLLGARGKVLAAFEPELFSLPGLDSHPVPAELPPDAARLRLYSFLAGTLKLLADDRPLVLVLDDLQWADDLTLGFLEFLVGGGHIRRMGLLVVGTYRTEEATDSLARIVSMDGTSEVRLSRLPEVAVGAMASDMLGLSAAPARFSSFLARQSEGNPFFIAEYLRTAIAVGLLTRDADGRWQLGGTDAGEAAYERLPLPGSVRELVSRRLQGIDGTARGILEVASVVGRDVEWALLSRALAIDEESALAAVRQLLARQILEEPRAGALRFVHDKIREVAYDGIAPDRRGPLHRTVAEALEASGARERVDHLAGLGLHWERAGEAGRARECYLPAARHAAASYAYAEAERLYLAYLDLAEARSHETIVARNELGERVYRLRGQHDKALRAHEEALADARAVGDAGAMGMSLTMLGRTERDRGLLGEAVRHGEQALSRFSAASDRHGEAMVLSDIAIVHHLQGRTEEARARYEQALQIHESLGNRRQQGSILGNLAALHREQGRIQQGLALNERALAIHREVRDRRFEAIALGNMALFHLDQGRMQEAKGLTEQALALYREIGDRRHEAFMLANLAGPCQVEGDLAKARDLLEEAAGIAKELADRRLLGTALTELAAVRRMMGDPEEGARIAEEALAIHRSTGERRGEGLTLGNLSRIRESQGRLADSLALKEEALGIFRESGDRRNVGILLWEQARLHRWLGRDLDFASQLAQEAARILDEVGEKLELAKCRCEQGRLALARGESAQPACELASTLRAQLDQVARGGVDDGIAALRRCIEAQALGTTLLRGEIPSELPEGLREHLRGHLRA